MITPLSLLTTLLFLILMLLLLRKFLFSRGRRAVADRDPGTSEIGFVTDTFQDLVRKLKDNERRLAELMARAEDRAILSESLSENILESVPSGVISFNENLEITMVNPAAERILGFERRQVAGRRADEVLNGRIARLIEEKKTVERQELSYEASPARQLWLGFSLNPLRDAGGRRAGLILVFTDLTELKVLERQAELRRRLSSLGEMAAGLAHELRNPMAVISGYAKLLARANGDQSADQSVDCGDREDRKRVFPSEKEKAAALAIGKEVAAMNSIINRFLSFANPATPSLEPLSRDDLMGILKTCMNATLAGGRGERISASLSSDARPFVVKADEILIKQAFMNLLQNAVQAMPGGGRLAVRVEEKEGQALISVSDTGPGIPEEMRQKIFLPFYTTREGGTGLGLAVVHGIISSHSGTIELRKGHGGDHRPGGEGSEFLIRLPLDSNLSQKGAEIVADPPFTP